MSVRLRRSEKMRISAMSHATRLATFLTVLCLTTSVDSAANTSSTAGIRSVQASSNNIIFDLPELTTMIQALDGRFQLEAFKSSYNDRVLHVESRNEQQPKISRLLWVSSGHPRFIRTVRRGVDPNSAKYFHFTRAGFYCMIEMLTPEHQQRLAEVASRIHHLNISSEQIVNLPLTSFTCSGTLGDELSHKSYLIAGKVKTFGTTPLRMDFYAPTHSIERQKFLQLLNEDEDASDLQFECTLLAQGKFFTENSLIITSSKREEFNLEEKLFGPAGSDGKDSVYVTRDQMTKFASELYSSLRIVEEYEMPETQFSEAFVEEFISQISTKTFSMVPVDEALASLSRYGFNIDSDLKADEIKRELQDTLVVERSGNNSKIVLDNQKFSQHGSKQSWTSSFGLDVIYEAFTGNLIAKDENDNSHESTDETQSHIQQLNELNKASEKHMIWGFEGNKVVPKSLNVAKLSRSKMSSDLQFDRIRRVTHTADYHKRFALHTNSRRFPYAGSDLKANYTLDTLLSNDCVQHVDGTICRLFESISSISSGLNLLIQQVSSVLSKLRGIEDASQRMNSSIFALQTTGPRACPRDFTYINDVGKCYKPVVQSKTWEEAARACRSIDTRAHLAFITSGEEQRHLESMLRGLHSSVCAHYVDSSYSPHGWFVGGQRIDPRTESRFVWKYDHTNYPVTREMTYTNWALGEPNNHPSARPESCLVIDEDVYLKWGDFKCSARFCFVCQVDV